MRCPACGSEMKWSTSPMTEEFKGVQLTVDGIGRHVCDACGEYIIGVDEAELLSKRLAALYAKRQGLLSPAEIVGIRKRLGLSQKAFEKMLGVSSPTASRWENGAMLQSKTADNLMRVVGEYPQVAAVLMERAGVAPNGVPSEASARAATTIDARHAAYPQRIRNVRAVAGGAPCGTWER